MSDFMQLRIAVARAEGAGRRFMEADTKEFSKLLDAYDALISGKKKAPPKDIGYPEAFEEAWAAYPSRPGASKAAAHKAWAARIVAGATPEEMLAGVRKYAAYVLAERTEKRFIKQPATFFGPGEHFTADWTSTKGAGRQEANNEAKRRLFGGYDEFGSLDAPG